MDSLPTVREWSHRSTARPWCGTLRRPDDTLRRRMCQNLHRWVTQLITIPPLPNPHTPTLCIVSQWPSGVHRLRSHGWALLPLVWDGAGRRTSAGCRTPPALSWHYLGGRWQLSVGHIRHERGNKRSEGAGFPHAISARRKEYLAFCASQGSMTRLLHSHQHHKRSTIFGVLLQTSEDAYLGGGHDKDMGLCFKALYTLIMPCCVGGSSPCSWEDMS